MGILAKLSMGKANLIGIGAPRTGTRSLRALLGSSPDIFMCNKEVNFFGIEPADRQQLYDDLFDAGASYRYRGEVTPVYLSGPGVAQAIFDYNPDAVVVATLREPVSRILSQYRYFRSYPDAIASQPLIAAGDIDAYLRGALGQSSARPPISGMGYWYGAALNAWHSRYEIHLPAFRQLFGRNLIILLFDEIGMWASQLGGRLNTSFRLSNPNENKANSQQKPSPEVLDQLRAEFAPGVHALSEMLRRDLVSLWGYSR